MSATSATFRFVAASALAVAAAFAITAANAQTIVGPSVKPPASILSEGQILVPTWPSKGYYYHFLEEDMMVVFETESPCSHPTIQALPEAGKKGLFNVTMYNERMTTIRAQGCSGIENGVAVIVWFDGNQGRLDMDELFPISKDTRPPEVTPSALPPEPRKPRI